MTPRCGRGCCGSRHVWRCRVVHPTDALDLSQQLAAPLADGPSADRLAVAEAMTALPAQMRAAIALHHVVGLSVP